MATRSAIIVRAQGMITQGTTDTNWSNTEWSDYYYDAVRMVHKRCVDSKGRFFIAADATLTKDSDNRYALPSDFHRVIEIQDPDGNVLSEATEIDVEQEDRAGYQRRNNYLELLGFDSYPATLTLKYYHKPKEMGDWDGTTDPSTTPYTPDVPLDTAEGARLLSRLIKRLALLKDEDLVADDDAEIQKHLDDYIEALQSWNREEPQFLGT